MEDCCCEHCGNTKGLFAINPFDFDCDRHICHICRKKRYEKKKKEKPSPPPTTGKAELEGRAARRNNKSLENFKKEIKGWHRNLRNAALAAFINEDKILGPDHSCY